MEPLQPMKSFGIFRSLRAKVVSQMLTTSLIPLLILAAIIFFSFRDMNDQMNQEIDVAYTNTQDTITNDMSNRASQIAHEIDNFLLNYIRDVQIWAASPTFIEAAQTATLSAIELELPDQDINTIEQMMRDDPRLNRDKQINTYLRYLVDNTSFAEIFFTERFGYNVAFSNRTSDFVQRDEAWWTTTWDTGLYLGNPEFDDSAEAHVIPISVRIDNPSSGEPLGVIKATLDLEGLHELTNTQAALYTGSDVVIFLIENGYRLADTRVEHDNIDPDIIY